MVVITLDESCSKLERISAELVLCFDGTVGIWLSIYARLKMSCLF
jgi:hypothetical protein